MIDNIDSLYNDLCDQESREIFNLRVKYSETGNCSYIDEIVDKFVRSKELWVKFGKKLAEISKTTNMYIYGAGVWGKILYDETHKDVHWSGCVDSNPSGKVFPINLINFTEFMEIRENSVVVISSYKNYDSIYNQLVKNGFDSKSIINAGEIINNITEGAMYFDLKELLPLRDKEYFVDCGCFDGYTDIAFFEWCKQNGYAYCIEIDEENTIKIKDNLKLYEGSFEIIDKAIWSKKTKLAINSTGDYSSSVYESKGISENEINADSIDNIFANKNITYIKMDIEGSELEALKGARNTIIQQKPRLAVSIYHKPEDVWDIISYLRSLNIGYKFFIRHYSFSYYDTVLYAL